MNIADFRSVSCTVTSGVDKGELMGAEAPPPMKYQVRSLGPYDSVNMPRDF